VIAALEDLHAGLRGSPVNGIPEHVHAAEVGREDDDLLVRMHRPQASQPTDQFLRLAFITARQLFQKIPDPPPFLRQGHRHQRRGYVFVRRRRRLGRPNLLRRLLTQSPEQVQFGEDRMLQAIGGRSSASAQGIDRAPARLRRAVPSTVPPSPTI
jgi:hypothetical protein